jgi:hypothetical protein
LLIAVIALSALTWAFRNFIDVKVIPANQQRYPTAGDWWFDSSGWHFRISKQPDRRYEWLIFVHEFTEAGLCRLMGVTQAQVDAFDTAYEQRRMGKPVAIPGKTDSVLLDEPGSDPAAPYHYEHLAASWLEHFAAVLLFVGWKTYNDTLEQEALLTRLPHKLRPSLALAISSAERVIPLLDRAIHWGMTG